MLVGIRLTDVEKRMKHNEKYSIIMQYRAGPLSKCACIHSVDRGVTDDFARVNNDVIVTSRFAKIF